MTYSIQCIHCMAVLKSKVPAPAGKNVNTTALVRGRRWRKPL